MEKKNKMEYQGRTMMKPCCMGIDRVRHDQMVKKPNVMMCTGCRKETKFKLVPKLPRPLSKDIMKEVNKIANKILNE